MKITKHVPPPAEPTFTVELSAAELSAIRLMVGMVGNFNQDHYVEVAEDLFYPGSSQKPHPEYASVNVFDLFDALLNAEGAED